MYAIIFGIKLPWRFLLNFQIGKVRGAPTFDLAKTVYTCITSLHLSYLVIEYLLILVNLLLLPNTIRGHARITVGNTDVFLQALCCMIKRDFIYLHFINLDHTLL